MNEEVRSNQISRRDCQILLLNFPSCLICGRIRWKARERAVQLIFILFLTFNLERSCLWICSLVLEAEVRGEHCHL
jgi:hypothetical protein